MNIAIAAFAASLLAGTMPRSPSRPPLCIYYISGHGFGHAARSVVMIRALLEAGYSVQVVSTVPSSFFLQSLPHIVVHSRRLDSGAVQTDALTVDAQKSLDLYHESIHQHRDELIEREVQFLKDMQADIVLTDATALACVAGKRAGITCAVTSNFCWDFIYSEMVNSLDKSVHNGKYDPMIAQLTKDYNEADAMIVYPGYNTPLGTIRRIHAPLISRLAMRSREAMRVELKIPPNTKVLLLGFGGHSTAWKLQDSVLPPNWVCLVLASKASEMPSDRFIALDPNIYAPDYVGAADVWIGKLGFGSVSEALAHAVPLVYIPRSSWPEERYLEEYVLQMGGGLAMPEAAFFGDSWAHYLNLAMDMKVGMTPVDTSTAPQAIVNVINDLIS